MDNGNGSRRGRAGHGRRGRRGGRGKNANNWWETTEKKARDGVATKRYWKYADVGNGQARTDRLYRWARSADRPTSDPKSTGPKRTKQTMEIPLNNNKIESISFF